VPIYALGEHVPVIDGRAYVHPDAVVIGQVTIGPESSIWPSAVLRGDDGEILIGAQTSIQDGCVLHTTREQPTTVGDRCVVGHLAHLEGCIIEHDSLIGSSSVVLPLARIGTGAIVAAGAVVLNGVQVPPGALALGVPARIREGAADPAMIEHSVGTYVARSHRFRAELRRLG
jgi:carbonic anhydrase/acetyltransferase-like protein (isoleucine patch superfamily)